MIIANSQVSLYSQTQFTTKHSSSRSVENSNLSRYQTKSTFEHSEITSENHYGGKRSSDEKNVEIVFKLKESQSIMIQHNRAVYDYEDNLSLEDRIKKIIIEKLLEKLGHKIDTPMYPNKKSNTITQNSFFDSLNPYTNKQANNNELTVIQTQEEYYQKQTVDFSASITIKTPNNTFQMNIDISFSQELYESRSTQLITDDERFLDPLIINYDEDVNPFENIGKLRFMFDLDNNGTTEMIPQLIKGAGYLALDKNENGKIDNGSELFGPSTNNGFAELAQYDEDKNNWIDEKDAIFDKLKIWSIDDKGNNSLVSLLDRNVGAIYLGDVQSGFKYQSAINQTDAVQKSNSIFVKEDGSGAGVVNSIDIVV
ncbi:MAG: hypothetical protein C0625_11525 [Arcobacter sp.]|nr:MAG: hypothetical protein C0625_11525 [Arcobacter sp.]